jgi:hypothetical protein
MKIKIKPNTANISNTDFSYNQYLLSQVDNYKDKINKDLKYILEKYIELIIDYIKFITEKINIKKNQYYKYIFIRGFDTITTVFKIMLFYTKNVDLTYYHSQKAFYFYVEFIEQISTDQNSFLQLSSREASLFVYKKTIFEINLEIKKKIKDLSNDDKNILNKFDIFLDIYKNIIVFFINKNQNDNIIDLTNHCEYLKLFNDKINMLELLPIQIECIHLIIDKFSLFNINNTVFFELMEVFVKKISNKKIMDINYEIIKEKIMDSSLENNLTNSKTFINWIFN